MIPYDKTEHGSWYWLWVDGPDGRHWMLGQREDCWINGFDLPGDGSRLTEVDHHDDGSISLRSKWTILEIHPCNPPEVTR